MALVWFTGCGDVILFYSILQCTVLRFVALSFVCTGFTFHVSVLCMSWIYLSCLCPLYVLALPFVASCCMLALLSLSVSVCLSLSLSVYICFASRLFFVLFCFVQPLFRSCWISRSTADKKNEKPAQLFNKSFY